LTFSWKGGQEQDESLSGYLLDVQSPYVAIIAFEADKFHPNQSNRE
jgi:hypothetical protein